ncbi:MAG: Trk system potassium transporter TrkA [Desulfobacterales bacterium]|nr:Trk system potassium transporter TrkA [Desulfobacterales bacterium]
MKVVIVGAGEVGFHIASRLALENKNVVVIDRDPEAVRRVTDNIDAQVITGSGGSPVCLEEAGIKEAEILLAVTDSDETNLASCLIANIISPSTKKLARIRDADFDHFHDEIRNNAPHIDTIINPEIEVVKTIDRLMRFPGAVDVGEFAGGRVKFVGISLDKSTSIAGVRLADLPAEIGRQRLLIAAILRGDTLIIPHGDDVLMAGDIIYFISKEEQLFDILEIFDKHAQPMNRVIIIGGGRIGFRLATLLEERSVHLKIIEKDADQCAHLADKLNKAVVIHGDGSSQELLREENIQEMDMVLTLTNDEESNILTSLLVKQMGVKNTITRINKFSYFPLMSTIGLLQIVSPRLSAINSILQHIRRGKVLSAISIKGEQAEVMEAEALETSGIVGKPLRKISFPKRALVTAIIRKDDIIIPSGDSVIEPHDRIIIFAQRHDVPKIEKILAVKLEYF